MTAAEKGDAIIKLIGGSAASLIGIGVDALLAGLGVDFLKTKLNLRMALATMFSGILSMLFMYLLDKADLFSVRAERRLARVREVFDACISDLKADTAPFQCGGDRTAAQAVAGVFLSQPAGGRCLESA